MNDYRINVRFQIDNPAEQKAAEFLKSLKGSRNKFVVDAVIAKMNQEFIVSDELLESIRQLFREEVQFVSVTAAPKASVTVSAELTEAQKEENEKNVLADLELFG